MAKIYGKLNEHLNTIMSKLLEHEDLCKFLHYDEPNIDVLAKPNVENKRALINQHLFKRKILPDVHTTAKTSISTRIQKVDWVTHNSSNLDKFVITFYVIVNVEVCSTKNGERDLALVTALHDIFNNKNIGIGTSVHYRTDELVGLNHDYCGYIVQYTVTDFRDKVLS